MDPLAFCGHSFWTHGDRIWKVCHKSHVFLMILPTCLLGCASAAHQTFLMLVSGLRHLEGQIVCAHEAKEHHLMSGVISLLVRSNFIFSAI